MPAGRNQRLSPVIIQSSIGLLLVVSLGVLAALVLWLRNIRLGTQSYRATFMFKDAAGMVAGTRVDYRGVRIGQVVDVNAQADGVALEVEISPGDRLISSDSRIEAKQSGLIGETSINIVPNTVVDSQEVDYKPTDASCDSDVIICDGTVLRGEDALDTNSLVRSMKQVADFFTEPEITYAIRALAQETPQALEDVSQFSDQAATLLKEINRNGGVQNLRQTIKSVDRAAQDLSVLSREATGSLRQFNNSDTLTELNRSLKTINQVAQQVQVFLAVNDRRLGATLVSLQGTSDELQGSIQQLQPPLTELLTQVNEQNTVQNLNQVLSELQVISANANKLTQNLNQFATSLNDPETILLLQQLLDSARTAVQNLEKVTSDIDEITGDPQIREELIRLIKGLSNLVSYTDYLQEQVQYAHRLNQISDELDLVAQAYQEQQSSNSAQPQQPSSSPQRPVSPIQPPKSKSSPTIVGPTTP